VKRFKVGRPSPAMIIAIVALVLAMVGTGYAAVSLPKKSVGTAQLKAKAVTNAKIKNGTITGKKLKLKTIGTVPNAAHASVADLANSVPPSAIHPVGAAGEPQFLSGSSNLGASGPLLLPGVSFLKDRDNIVHLEGIANSGEGAPFPGALFQLPPGFRPPSGAVVIGNTNEGTYIIAGSNVVIEGKDISGLVITEAGEPAILTGISFFAAS
jgi:hypothetical protein